MSSSDAESISCAASILNGATHDQLVNGYGQMNSAGYCINEILVIICKIEKLYICNCHV